MQGDTSRIPKGVVKKERGLLSTLVVIALLLLTVFAIIVFVLQTRIGKDSKANIQINDDNSDLVLPYTLSTDSTQVAFLYFGVNNAEYLAGQLTSLKVKSNQIPEEVAIEMLLEGPTKGKANLISLLPEAVSLQKIEGSGDTLYLTFDKNILKKYNVDGVPNEEESINRRNKMLYSIVNTVTNMGSYSKVQVLVDNDGTGVGVVPSGEEFGYISQSNSNGPLPALRFDESKILNSKNTAREILRHWENAEWTEFYNLYLAQKRTNEESLSLIEFESAVREKDVKISKWEIKEVSEDSAEDVRIVFVDIEYMSSDRTVVSKEGIPMYLRRENGLWKIPYNVVERVLFSSELN